MATIKLKRSETSGDEPSTSDLETGEVAVNIADYVLFTKNSAGAITKIANYAEADTSLIFPTGDYGNVTDAAGTDAFGQQVSTAFDMNTTIKNRVQTKDIGSNSEV
jgi:hypothetical protein